MRLLDLFCGAGAVARGYVEAGFDVVGVDIKPQPSYPFPFIQADALADWMPRFIQDFDAVHASPPCLGSTVLKASARREEAAHGRELREHPDLISPTREMLKATGKPYVIENVMQAPLHDPVVLNGYMFGLSTTTSDGRRWFLERKRKFEANFALAAPTGWVKQSPVIGCYGAHVRCRAASAGGRLKRDFAGEDKPRMMAEAMGLLGANQTMEEMSQAVPPAYTLHVGIQLARHIRGHARG